METIKQKRIIFFILTIIGAYMVLFWSINIENYTLKVFSYVSNPTPYTDYIIGLIVYVCITFLVFLTKNRAYFIIWNIKAFITLVFMITYEHMYWLDAYGYYSVAISDHYNSFFNADGTHNMKYLNYLFTYIVGNSYYSLKLLNSFIGFLAILLFYKSYLIIMNKLSLKVEKNFIYWLFLLPSILFWSSIMGKDPMNLFFTSVFTYSFIHLLIKFKLRYIIFIGLSMFLVGFVRPWFTMIYLFTIIFYYLKLTDIKQIILAFLLAPVGYIMLMSFLHKFGVDSIDALFLGMSTVAKNMAYGGSSTSVAEIRGFGDYLIYFIPNFITAVFRPLLFDARNPFTALAAIENTILIYMFYKYILKNFILIYQNKYMKFLMVYILAWSLFYVILSPGNLGMAVRFKLQILPAMMLLIFISRSIVLAKDKKDTFATNYVKIDN